MQRAAGSAHDEGFVPELDMREENVGTLRKRLRDFVT